MKLRLVIGCAILAVLALSFHFFSANDPIDYSSQVKPILNKKCMSCHGGVKREAGFSLLFRQEALAKAESGKIPIVPGDVDHSELVRRINSNDPEERMPYKKDPLTKEEIAVLTQWIEEGAKWGDHWAYLPVKGPQVPDTDQWATNDIDRFILKGLDDVELTPSAAAPKEILLRRVSLDLVGLPPTVAWRDQYLNSKDPQAYEVLVDSLLNSPRFGERWTAMWLDLARYSDTKGYERDYIRSIWRYRDWLIRAFNRDLPYDSFLIQQLAGDLLVDPTNDQYLATAFHRNTMTNDEGGTDNEEFRTAAVIDRVNTTWEALMGTTFSCVQCHSHPYDPFRHEEYYKFMSFFNNTRDEDTYDDYPVIRHFAQADEKKLNEIVNWVQSVSTKEKASEIRMLTKTWQPAINSLQADQLVNSAIHDTKWLIMRDQAEARIPAVDMTGYNKMIYRFAGHKGGGVWTIRADSRTGPVIKTLGIPSTNHQMTIAEADITPMEGSHDLYFSYTNPNLKTIHESGVMFDWFFFTDKSIPWEKEPSMKNDFWTLLTKPLESTPVMIENPQQLTRTTQVFERGNWLVKGDTVSADVPASLLAFPADEPRNRMGLAKWMTDPQHPLTSRTVVNRLWEQLFGMGLAETLEDMGTQGIAPVNQELLDHLSYRLMTEYKWSLKRLLKEIVMSSTYRQSSNVTPEHMATDAANRYYARAPRVRLSAEQVRDQALAVSGLMSTKMYGPGVMPYQPDKIWLSPYNGREWIKSKGEDQYRRAVYTYWKRTAPYPSMMTFDGSAREVCMARRIRTNTPLQALVTLNDSVYVEASAQLAKRMKATGSKLEEHIAHGYFLAMGYQPSQDKLAVLVALHNSVATGSTIKKVNSSDDEQLIEDKPLMLVANAILNLDEFVTKE
jgi:hypothetical protein